MCKIWFYLSCHHEPYGIPFHYCLTDEVKVRTDRDFKELTRRNDPNGKLLINCPKCAEKRLLIKTGFTCSVFNR